MGSSASAAVPRAASLAMAFDELSLRQLVRCRYRTRCRQPIVWRDARQRLAAGEAAVDFGALEMLTGVASSHAPDQSPLWLLKSYSPTEPARYR